MCACVYYFWAVIKPSLQFELVNSGFRHKQVYISIKVEDQAEVGKRFCSFFSTEVALFYLSVLTNGSSHLGVCSFLFLMQL